MSENTSELDAKLLAYMRGELPDNEREALSLELEANEVYMNRLERLMFNEMVEHERTETIDLDESKKQQILKKSKWRNRFSNAGVTSLLIGGVVLSVLIISQILNYVWFWAKAEEVNRVAKDVVHFTQPGLVIGSSGTSGGLFFSMETKWGLEQHIGNGSRAVGVLKGIVSPLGITAIPEWDNGQYRDVLSFRIPGPNNHNQSDQDMKFAAWRKLELLPEGTVSQMAISFDHYLSFDEYFQLIDSTYDVRTSWLAIDTGQEPELGQNNLAKTYWGFFPRDIGYFGSMQAEGEGKKFEQAYLQEMSYLMQHEATAEKIARGIGVRTGDDNKLLLKERFEYLHKNGVRIYGAVVTGPTKDLLKMKKETFIQGPVVGAVDWWNWDRAPGPGVGSW